MNYGRKPHDFNDAISNLETVTKELRAKLRTRPGTVATQPPLFAYPPRWRSPPSTATFPRNKAEKSL
ncbi:hypothetical protein HMPREF1980_01015 [Actinomyces sp. oral taxon 172 str. F0311]|nr:hypothetical protein HMPREF1980_01015 [Actinomyces sp. oral taxon 172 str. F0311]